jgi:hypothetical protein
MQYIAINAIDESCEEGFQVRTCCRTCLSEPEPNTMLFVDGQGVSYSGDVSVSPLVTRKGTLVLTAGKATREPIECKGGVSRPSDGWLHKM